MQYAVISTGGKQYIVTPGQEVVIESLPQQEGESLTFPEVLLQVDGDAVSVGKPFVSGVSVSATVVRHDLGDKIHVFKYRPKSRYRRAKGHRQHQTIIKIDAIGAAKAKSEPKVTEAAPKAAAKPRAKAAPTKE